MTVIVKLNQFVVKTRFLFFSIILAAFLSSAMPFGSHSLKIGAEAPSITFSTETQSQLKLENAPTLINFWSIYNPQSRIDNNRLANAIAGMHDSKINFVSICIDTDETLHKEIILQDKIDDKGFFFNRNDINEEVFKDYQTSTGLRSFLLNDSGELLAINPSENDIMKAFAN